MNDVRLEGNGERTGQPERSVDAGVEALAVIASVDALPIEPDVLPESTPGEEPLQACFVGPIECQRLPLDRWKQPVRAIQVRPCRTGV